MKSRLLQNRAVRCWWIIFACVLPWFLTACGKQQLRNTYPQPTYQPHQQDSYSSSPRPYPSTGRRNSSGPPTVAEQCPPYSDKPRTIIHEVGPLETVWRLSRMYDVPAESIYAANHLKPGDAISIGQKLTIPNAKPMRHVVSLYPNDCWKYIVIHHTATDVGKALQIDRNHQDRGFWNGLGYHFLIDNGTMGKGDGQIEVSPRWIKQLKGAHCKAGGMNEKSIGIALVGNFSLDLPTKNQMDSLAYLLRLLSEHYRIPPSRVVGHRDVDGASTECPGKRFPWATVRQCMSRF